jgi:hypothetical protein
MPKFVRDGVVYSGRWTVGIEYDSQASTSAGKNLGVHDILARGNFDSQQGGECKWVVWWPRPTRFECVEDKLTHFGGEDF